MIENIHGYCPHSTLHHMKTSLRSFTIACIALFFQLSSGLPALAQNPGVKIHLTPAPFRGTVTIFLTTKFGVPVDTTITVKNDPSSPMAAGIAFGNFGTKHFSILSSTSQFSLQPDSSASLRIRFNADSAGVFLIDTLSLVHNGDTSFLKSPFQIKFFATATAVDTIPRITVTVLGSPTRTIKFGQVGIGSSDSGTFTIKNTTNAHLTLTGNFTSPSSPFSFGGGVTTFSLDSGISQGFGVRFTPKDTGAFSDSIQITSNTATSTKRIVVYLNGTGFAVNNTLPSVTILTQTIIFPLDTIGNIDTAYFSILNSSDSAYTLRVNITPPDTPFSLLILKDSMNIGQHDSVIVPVLYAATNTGISRDSIVVVTNSNAPTARIVIRLRGQGIVRVVNSVASSAGTSPLLSLYPNPATGELHLLAIDHSIRTVQLLDIMGRTVWKSETAPSSERSIDLRDFPAGSYLLRTNVDGTTVSQRFEIVR